MNCPFCESIHVIEKDKKYKCKSCGKEFESLEDNRLNSSLSFNNKITGYGISNFSSNRYSNVELSSEKIYELGIKGTALIECEDLGYLGSGFLVNNKGMIITNAHVITNYEINEISKEIYVTINNVKSKACVVDVGDLDGCDLALLQLERRNYNQIALSLGNSDNTKIGAKVYAIGNSLGEGLCITAGIISDKERLVFNEKCFMSDVAFNSGNSGGPLLNIKWEVIAICVAGKNNVKGMNYFIPINKILSLLKNYL